jgi:hypothetical protein
LVSASKAIPDFVFDEIKYALQEIVAHVINGIGQPSFEIQKFPLGTDGCDVQHEL